ncbi:MAG: prepilin-type cleavage/methylation domain-containing protein [Betaproteobacteria bacterium HGW-Betaproteobacteria-7]|jgi:prepilin-type N-terminal cleavage/methylation domain-containing protein|nr:MAG: prepilin-type cleavage/methylation domain-containing protein [Betaproteobacteria bacterium HGW-Betaproteobacteria-7]
MTPLPSQAQPRSIRASGFSLVEMAIVLVIFALLAGGLMMTLTTQQEIQRLSEARRQLADIREALLGYAVINGRLPTPADPSIASGSANAGIAATTLTSGVLPWATLGLPETDPWGQRFTYRVDATFASAFTLATPGASTFKVTDGAVNIATNLPAIVISHGRNGLGGYRSTGTQVPNAAGDELLNTTGTPNFVSRTHTPDFDDEVVWVPLPILMSRMITAGRLP